MSIRIVCIVTLFCSLFYACIKNEAGSDTRTSTLEKQERTAYLKKENITVTATSLGVYNVTQSAGTGATIAFGDTVTVKYKSYLLNGTQFADTTETFIFGEHDDGLTDFKTVGGTRTSNDDDAIPGIDNGIWKMKEGGKARLVVPSEMAYGTTIKTNVPIYSTIVVDVEITKVRTGIHPTNFYNQFLDSSYTTYGVPIFYAEHGTGTKLSKGKTVTLRETGYLGDGYLFYSSVIVNQTIKMVVDNGDVVIGLDDAITLMRVGDKCRVIIPYTMEEEGYGAYGWDPYIPPYATLVFDVEILSVN